MKYPFPIIVAIAIRHLQDLVSRVVDKIRTCLLLKIWGIKHGMNVVFEGPTILLAHQFGDIAIGDNVLFNARVEKNLVGLMNPTILSCIDGGYIRIGNNCGFSSVVISSRVGVEIGDYATVGGNVRIFDHDFHSVDSTIRRNVAGGNNIRRSKVVIGDDVFIGTNAILLKGTKIGSRSIIAAGSVIFGLDIPADSMVKGNPAIIVGQKGK